MLEMINLPRQARDKHSSETQKSAVFLYVLQVAVDSTEMGGGETRLFLRLCTKNDHFT
eukprot:COSAG06_NODE_769_length_12440_cov_7.241796_11_plen_58_part_00